MRAAQLGDAADHDQQAAARAPLVVSRLREDEMSARPPYTVPPVLPCGHLSGLSYVAADGLTAWCMVCEIDVELGGAAEPS